MIVRGDATYVEKGCAASLERLGMDYIDLYYRHRVNPNTHIEETVTAMAELKNEGNIEYLDLSGCSATTLRRYIPILGTKRVKYLGENAKAVEVHLRNGEV